MTSTITARTLPLGSIMINSPVTIERADTRSHCTTRPSIKRLGYSDTQRAKLLAILRELR